jgi:hypothetical protein
MKKQKHPLTKGTYWLSLGIASIASSFIFNLSALLIPTFRIWYFKYPLFIIMITILSTKFYRLFEGTEKKENDLFWEI